MSRRALGWLLLLGSPGLMAGITLTLTFVESSANVSVPDGMAFTLWGAAGVAPAVGGYCLPTHTASKKWQVLAALAGAAFGAVMFFVTLIVADALIRPLLI